MPSVDYFLTKKPSDIQAVFVSDLHLSAQTDAFNRAFVHLLTDLSHLPHLDSLYILGDWLDGWIGDDDYLSLDSAQKNTHWLTPILTALTALSQKNIAIYVMCGNRDFTISQKLCDIFHGVLIKEPYQLTTKHHTIRLEHGDALCTDDKSYQRYRSIIRNRVILQILLMLPLSYRRKIAGNIKQQSRQDKQKKSSNIMDVNPKTVQDALQYYDVLLHGHTHRPAIHTHENKTRIVLGDWRLTGQKVSAHIVMMIDDELHLAEFHA